MTPFELLLGLVTALVTVYLLFTLLRAERF